MNGNPYNKDSFKIVNGDNGLPVTFNGWLYQIRRESLGTLSIDELRPHIGILREIFDKITVEKNGAVWLSEEFNHMAIRENIRKAFVPKHTIMVNKEILPQQAELLREDKLEPEVHTATTEKYYPDQNEVLKIVSGGKHLKKKIEELLNNLNASPGMENAMDTIKADDSSYEDYGKGIYKKSYHYLPYRFDSPFEISYFSQSLLTIINDKELEVYYNGDDTLTNFKIRCYQKKGENDWKYLGLYVPDFIMISRDEKNAIRQVLIIETKGKGYAAKFKEKKDFMSSTFLSLNNQRSGYNKFQFLYVEDSLPSVEQDRLTLDTINSFFEK